MITDLVNVRDEDTKSLLQQVDDIFDRTDPFTKIATRAVDNDKLAELHTFDEQKLQNIADAMPEINRATRSFGRKNTQTTNRLMTLTMLAGSSPMRVIRQCLAQIETKRNAIKENRFKLLKDKLKLEKVVKELDILYKERYELEANIDENDSEKEKELLDLKYKIGLKEIKKEEIASGISDAMLYVEGALKDIVSFQSSYKQICKNKDIPENWDEKDMEEAEVRHHIRMSMLHCVRDVLVHGTIGMGTAEYVQQFGIHPLKALKLVRSYLANIDSDVSGIENIDEDNFLEKMDVEDLELFLDDMEETFKDEYKKVLERIGLTSLYEKDYMYLEEENKR